MNYKKGLPLSKLNSLLIYLQKQLLPDGWDLSIKIIEFKRKDYRKSVDIKVFPDYKKAIVFINE